MSYYVRVVPPSQSASYPQPTSSPLLTQEYDDITDAQAAAASYNAVHATGGVAAAYVVSVPVTNTFPSG